MNFTGTKQIFRSLKNRNYRLYFIGQSISLIGTWIQILAMGWLVYDLTNSAFMLGLIGFASRLPTLFIGPFAGVIIDRMNKFKLLLITQILSMIQAIIITVLLFTGVIQIWHILLLGIFLGVVNTFDMPVRQSLVIKMIEQKEDLNNAIALNSAMVNAGRLIGPTIAGLLVAAFGEKWCFLINALSFVAIIATLLMMKLPAEKIEYKKSGPLKELKEGFKYAYNFIPIRYILMLLALVSLMGMPIQVLMPIFAKDIFQGGPHTFGYLMGAFGIGALTGAIYLASRTTVLGLGKKIAIAAGIFGSGLILFSLSSTLWLSLIIITFVGLGMMLQMTSSNTILQTIVDDDKRGRVMSFYSMAFMGTVPFGNLLAGTMSDLIGVTTTILVGGICIVIGAVVFAFKLPQIRQLVRPIYVSKEIITPDIFR
ncbi:MAG: MFS transporter [Ignavibacteria bacterium]|nr:MFS transporter [Ignavibacteria bacterium]